MDLESAIQHLRESLADPTHKWGCEECKQEHEQLLEWLEDYKRLKGEMISAYDEAEIDAVIAEIQRCTDLSTPGFVIRSAETLRDEIAMLKDYKQLKADYADLDNKLRTANTENDELKRLLGLAIETMQVMSCGIACSQCVYEKPIGEDENGDYINSPHCDKSDCFEWEYYGEAMKLLGGTDNAEN